MQRAKSAHGTHFLQPEWNELYVKSVPRQLKKYVLSVPPPKAKQRRASAATAPAARDEFEIAP